MKSTSQSEHFFSVSNLSKSFDDRIILRDVNIEIEKGDFMTLIGKSGTGKTTFLNIVGLLDKHFLGDVSFLGYNIKKDRRASDLRRREIGYLFQSFYLLDYLNVKDNILLPYKYIEGSPDLAYFDSLCEKLGISNILSLNCNVLSGGEKQRVSLARALIKKPSFLICDEPTGNLDKESRDVVLSLLARINKEYSTTILIVTHDDYIASKGARQFVLNDGAIYEKDL